MKHFPYGIEYASRQSVLLQATYIILPLPSGLTIQIHDQALWATHSPRSSRLRFTNSEFPEDQALLYTSPDDESKTCTFRLSVNRGKVLCKLAENMYKDHPIRFDTKITAEGDSNGDCNFGQVTVATNGTIDDSLSNCNCSSLWGWGWSFYDEVHI